MSKPQPLPENPNNEQLLNYLSGKLDAANAHALEQQMQNDPFVDDAVEGLQALNKNPIALQQTVYSINKKLQQHLNEKKQLAEKRKIKEMPWIAMAIALVLFLSVAGYFIIRLYLKHKTPLP
ncbi:MAG: hypothetical protein ACK4HE_05795 [Chitinophagaceae bacterium]